MKQKDTQAELQNYFQHEKRIEASEKLQEKIAQQTYKKNMFSLRRLAIPVAAMLLLALGLSLWTAMQKQKTKQEIAASQILYEDEDFVIYVQN